MKRGKLACDVVALVVCALGTIGCPQRSTPAGAQDMSVPDLAGADLVGADLIGADLTGSPLDLLGDLASSIDAGGCVPDCAAGFTCCGSKCVNLDNDILNCGICARSCGGTHPYCDTGACATDPPCNGLNCFVGFCCGNTCCSDTELCCNVKAPGPTTGPKCYDPAMSGGTCPGGCPLCL